MQTHTQAIVTQFLHRYPRRNITECKFKQFIYINRWSRAHHVGDLILSNYTIFTSNSSVSTSRGNRWWDTARLPNVKENANLTEYERPSLPPQRTSGPIVPQNVDPPAAPLPAPASRGTQPPSPTPKMIFASSSSEKLKVPIAPARGQSFVRTASPLDVSGARAEREARTRVGLLSAADVGERLLRLGVGAALKNNIDGPNLLALTDADLVGMGIQERYSRELILRAIACVVAGEREQIGTTAGRAEELPSHSQ
ncbi:hypothetical protein HDU96_001571 [Phlyctochytrium bullatum]|nr:hypothetical protein HDU96_001571 [Phlyctochytrium bullatum]